MNAVIAEVTVRLFRTRAKSAVDATLTFGPTDNGTSVKWSGNVTELGGLLKLVPQGLIQAAAQKVIADVWASIRQRL